MADRPQFVSINDPYRGDPDYSDSDIESDNRSLPDIPFEDPEADSPSFVDLRSRISTGLGAPTRSVEPSGTIAADYHPLPRIPQPRPSLQPNHSPFAVSTRSPQTHPTFTPLPHRERRSTIPTEPSRMGQRPSQQFGTDFSRPRIISLSNMSTLRALEYLDGDLETLPDSMYRQLQSFCFKHNTQDLPCAKTVWTEVSRGTTAKYTNGDDKIWTYRPQNQQLRVGRWKYGSRRQIIVAQGGRDFEEGKVVILVNHQPSTWKVWRDQATCADIPGKDIKVFHHPNPTMGRPESTNAHSNNLTSQQAMATRPSQPGFIAVAAASRPPLQRVENSIRDFEGSDQAASGFLKLPHERVLAISYKEGEIGDMAPELMQLIQAFCDLYPTAVEKPPFAARAGGACLTKCPDGNSKVWRSVPDNEPLMTGLFSYGEKYQFIIVQGAPGSKWQQGTPRIIIHSKGSNYYKIWAKERLLADIESAEVVKWEKVEDRKDSDEDTDEEEGSRDPLPAPSRGRGSRSDAVPTDRPQKRLGFSDFRSPLPAEGTIKVVAPPPLTRAGKRRREETEEDDTDSQVWSMDKKRARTIADAQISGQDTVLDGALPASTVRSTQQTHYYTSGKPLQMSASSQLLGAELVRRDSHTKSVGDHVESDFDISTVTIFFMNGSGQYEFDCAFSEAPDIRRLFARARVARIATADTLLLEATVGNVVLLLQKDMQRDFETMEDAIANSEVTEISIREEMV